MNEIYVFVKILSQCMKERGQIKILRSARGKLIALIKNNGKIKSLLGHKLPWDSTNVFVTPG
jgi:hypothetical protein